MNGLVYFLIAIGVIFISISWILPILLSWVFEKKFQISVRIGKIALPYLKLCNIQIIKNGFHIHIEEIGIKSSFLNSDLTKLVTLVVRDVRINKDIAEEDEHLLTAESIPYEPLDFRDKQVPNLINTFIQFTAVHIYSISAMFLRAKNPGCLIHSTASELHLDGSIFKNAKSLLVTLNLMDASAKVLRHADMNIEEPCLAEFGFGISLETILVAQGPLSVEKLEIRISKTSAQVKDGFYSLGNSTSTADTSRKSCGEGDSKLFQRMLPLIPKNCFIKIEETSLKGIRESGQVEYNSSLRSVILNYRTITSEDDNNDERPIIFAFYMHDLLLQNIKEKLIILKSFKIDAKLRDYTVNLYLQLNTLLITYVHSVIHKWLYDNFLKYYNMKKTELTAKSSCAEETNLERILRKLTINVCAEFCHVSSLFHLNKRNSSLGFKHMRIMLDQAQEIRTEDAYVSRLPCILLGKRHWQVEVLLESFWWSFKENGHEFNNPKVTHVWGTPAYIGMCLCKLKTTERSSEIKIGSLIDTVQFEWSLELADYILVAIKCIKQYNVLKHQEVKTMKRSPNLSAFSLNLVASHFNFFFQSQNSEYFVFRLNILKYDRNLASNMVQFEECKIFNLNNTGDYYSCMRTEDISNYKVFIKCINMELSRDKKDWQFNFGLEDVTVFWSTNLHLKALLLYKDILEFLGSLKEELALDLENSSSNNRYGIKLAISGCFAFHMDISENHSAKISLFETEIHTKNVLGLSLHIHSILIAIDNSDIFTINGFKMLGVSDHALVRQERLDAENFQLSWNDTWSISVELFKAVFPYEHNYAEAVQNQFLSIVKWLKIIHKRKSAPFEQGKGLPTDLVINVKEFLFEMSDDPFEVKLRDNFELLVDEYNESLKRQKVLNEKVAQLCKVYLHLPAGTVDDLYSKLKKKNAEIYVQRSKQMQQTPARTRLFAWSMTKLEIVVLADPSIHGLNNVINTMREIDAEAPWPEEGIEFSILWCRVVSLRCKEWKFQLRDFPQPLLDIRQFFINGTLVGAEQQAPKRAIRTVRVELGEPFEPYEVERGMLPMKYYHDFNCEVKSYSYAFGPCWEPVIAMCNLCFEKIIPPSRDPSPPLPFWDKMRLFLHGRLTMVVDQLTVLLHASLDPYNTTEEMELTWNNLIMDWTNAKFIYKGDLNIFVRTASKYDDCQLLHLPNLKLIMGIKWNCLSDPNDHHNVIQCAPDKIPEYSSNQVHDSFRAFRSQNVSLSLVLETRPPTPQHPTVNFDNPTLVLYGSTMRWIENLKLILSGVTRPTKRGKIFSNVRPRKIQLSRHYKKVHLIIGLHKFQVCYWLSYAMHRGCELLGDRLSSTSEHILSLVPIDDGLKHRPKAEWSILYMTTYLNDSEIWLKSALQDDTESEKVTVTQQPVEKCFCLSVAKVSYGREAVVSHLDFNDGNKDTPTHRLVVYDLKGAWTKSNRNVALALYDTFMKSRQLKKNLSTDLLKIFRKDSNSTPLKRRNTSECPGTPPNASALQALQGSSSIQDGTPGSQSNKLQMGQAANMLQQLIAEAENNSVVYSDDLSATRQQHLQGLQACQEDDVQYNNWQISLVNAQVLLKGCETKGYVILSAAKADILQRIHRPAWKDRTLVSKTTWTGLLECMQYYATVNAGENDCFNENIMWLTINNIQEKESTQISEPSEVPNMVGSGVSVGAVVSDTVGPTNSSQLQRIVSRCKCEFFYANYGDISVDPENLCEVPAPPQEEVDPWNRSQGAVDAFTLMHHDLEVCTNSLQYAMVLDIVNNLLLYVEPHRKEALEKLARMRFQLQLHSVEDQRKPIQNQQTLVRTTVSKLRRLEKNSYLISKALAENPEDVELLNELNALLKDVNDCKNQLIAESEELDMMLSCYKEGQLLANSRLATTRSDKPVTVVRSNEICFKHAQWRLTEADGLIGIADLVLSNFLYTKKSNSDDSVVHLLELGYLRMMNLLPNEIYQEVICPTEIQFEMPIEHKKVLRIFCREKPPVGGISVKEHFEINLVPLKIELTKKFYNTMMKFCFPERDTEQNEFSDRLSDDGENETKGHKKSKSGRKNRDSSFYVPIDDVEIMKERAEKNKLFVYIKIPEVPIRLSYKGSKEKNLEDLRDISLVIPTLEYHNMTWTWLDLLMAIRNDSKSISVVSQAIKQKLIKRKTGAAEETNSPQEEDKARMLFGGRHAPENRSIRKGVGGVFKFGKGT